MHNWSMIIIPRSVSDRGGGSGALVLSLIEKRLVHEVGIDWHRWGGQRSLGVEAVVERLKIGPKLIPDLVSNRADRRKCLVKLLLQQSDRSLKSFELLPEEHQSMGPEGDGN